MDRTGIAPYKAEERELGETLYKKLDGLMLVFPPTEEFRRLCTNDMFLKSNQTAFFHVMHYLFRLHDPNEFKKRFYWPISDKRSEAAFRSATVEYLKFLSDKHQLNWNIKTYLTVMPGGMKFISFLLDLIGFIVQEQIRHREKQLGLEISQKEVSELNLKRMKKQNSAFKEYAAEYICVVDEEISKLRASTMKLKANLYEFESRVPNCRIDKNFIRYFNEMNKELFEEKCAEESYVLSLEKPLNDLRESIEKCQNRAAEVRKDKSNLMQSLQKIAPISNSPEFSEVSFSSHRLDSIRDGTSMNSLVMSFALIAPTINEWMGKVIELNNAAIGINCTSSLFDLKMGFEEVEQQIADFQKKYNKAQLKSKERSISSLPPISPTLFKYVFTPPIKLSIAENISARLPLQDETNLIDRCSNYFANSFMTTIRGQNNNNKDSTRDQSFDLNNSTLNGSKAIDPVQLLRTIYKTSAEKSNKARKAQLQQRHNLSLLGIKWKERQEMMFGSNTVAETPVTTDKICEPVKLIQNCSFLEQHTTSGVTSTAIITPKTPFNTTNSGEITRIALTLSCEKSSPSTSLLKKPLNFVSPSTTMLPTMKPSVVKKVQDSLMNIKNVSTSPSSRLEPIIAADDNVPLDLENFHKNNERSHGIDSIDNDAYILNTPIIHKFNLSNVNVDEIFNTSDTILNEILKD